MKVGIEIRHSDYKKMKKHGFDCIDFAGLTDVNTEVFRVSEEEFREIMAAEKKRADSAGVEVDQVHAPWPTDDTTEDRRRETLKHMKRAILGTALLGSNYFVVHPVMPFGWGAEPDADVARQLNKEFLIELTDYARPLGVTICLENMPFTACRLSYVVNIVEFLKELNIDNLAICLDTGHANVCKEAPGDMVRLCGKYLKTLHVHDNNGHWDEHALPYYETIDWSDFKKALKEIGFQGCLTLELHELRGCSSDIEADMLDLCFKIAKSLC